MSKSLEPNWSECSGGHTLRCTNCGNELSSERTELGYSYCTREECVAACFEPVDVVALAVNKAADQYLLRRHLDLPEHPPRPEVDRDTLGALGLAARAAPERPRARPTAT